MYAEPLDYCRCFTVGVRSCFAKLYYPLRRKYVGDDDSVIPHGKAFQPTSFGIMGDEHRPMIPDYTQRDKDSDVCYN